MAAGAGPEVVGAAPLVAAGEVAESMALEGAAAGRRKVLHFMRHAESIGNAAGNEFPKGDARRKRVYEDERYFDAELSEAGLAQCRRFREAAGVLPEPALVLASPLTRALQTATVAFGCGDGGPPLVVLEELREFNSSAPHPCDWRRPRKELEPRFPHANFGEVAPGDDPVLGPGRLETAQHCDGRVARLLAWLRRRPEASIACVSHNAFLKRVFYKHLQEVGWSPLENPGKFGNAEVRSVAVVFT